MVSGREAGHVGSDWLPKVYDVCIIGSGAAGGVAAKVLTEGGLNVAMLEAGPSLDPSKDFKEHLWPYDLPHRGAGIGGKLKGEESDEFMAPNGAWEIEGEPYVSALGFDLPLVPLASRRRPHQPLGQSGAALGGRWISSLALSWRASEYLLTQSRMGNL